jgi:hypothetical protein
MTYPFHTHNNINQEKVLTLTLQLSSPNFTQMEIVPRWQENEEFQQMMDEIEWFFLMGWGRKEIDPWIWSSWIEGERATLSFHV